VIKMESLRETPRTLVKAGVYYGSLEETVRKYSEHLHPISEAGIKFDTPLDNKIYNKDFLK